MSKFHDEDRPESTFAHLAAPAGVALVILSVVLLTLQALGALPATTNAQVVAGILGIVGGCLLWRFMGLDWRRAFKARDPSGRGVLRAWFRFGPEAVLAPVSHAGTVHIQEGELVLRFRTFHGWLFALTYILGTVVTRIDARSELWSGLVLVGFWMCLVLYAFVHRRILPLSGVRLAVVDGTRVVLYHGTVKGSSETTFTMEKPALRRLREMLTPLVPVEVIPPPARVRLRSEPPAPRVPPVPPPPRTAIDGRKVKELDRAMRSLDRMNPPADASNLPPS